MKSKNIPLPFYMSDKITYDIKEKNKDRDYFKQNYTVEMKQYLRVIVEILNRLDQPESFWYDEYPDKIRLERLLDFILRNIPLEKNQTRESQRNVIRVLLWDEIIGRRNSK